MANYLPNPDNITLHGGELFFQKIGGARPYSLGFVDVFSREAEIETLEIPAQTKGVRSIVKTITKETKVKFSLTLKELRSDNLTLAVLGDEVPLVQAAATSAAIALTNVSAGEIHIVGHLNLSALALTDGDDPLVLGTDYTVDMQAGVITFQRALPTVGGTFSAPAILEGAGKTAINILTRPGGLEGVFTVVGYVAGTGNRYMYRDMRAIVRPTGSSSIISDGDDATVIELEGEGVLNSANPTFPWGRILPLDPVA